MSRLDELIAELCPDGVEFKALGDVCAIYDGTHQTPRYTDNGVKFVSVENINDLYASKKYISEDDYQKNYKIKPDKNDIFMTRIGTIGACAVIDGSEPLAYYVTLTLIRPNQNKIISKYLKYVIESKHGKKELWRRTLVNASPIKINLGEIGKIKIPVPPLSVQEEVVRILDKFTGLTAELTAELAKRKQQYQYYSQDLFSKYNNNFIALGNIAEIGTGSSNTNEEVDDGDYPFFVRSQEIRKKDTWEYDETAIITAGDGVGVGKIFHYIEGKYALHQRAYRIHIISKNVLPKYFFYYMKNTFLSYITQNAVHASVTSIRKRMLDNYLVPVPPLEEQKRIVAILDRFDALCNDLTSGLPAEIEARKKQYEYYRDKLLTFKEAV